MEKVQAIVLSATPYSETTLVVRLLTREHGVIRALAKGARRPKSRLHGLFEGFNCVQAMLSLRDADKLGTLGESSIVRAWPWLRDDLARFAYAGLGLEVLGRLAESSPEDSFFFEEAVEFLEILGKAEGVGSVTIALLLRLLHHGGFHPEIAEGWTAATLPAVVAYDFQAGALVAAGAGLPRHQMRLPGEALAPIFPALAEPPTLGGTFRVPTGAGPVVLRWLIRVWEDHLGTKLKAAEFLEKMVL